MVMMIPKFLNLILKMWICKCEARVLWPPDKSNMLTELLCFPSLALHFQKLDCSAFYTFSCCTSKFQCTIHCTFICNAICYIVFRLSDFPLNPPFLVLNFYSLLCFFKHCTLHCAVYSWLSYYVLPRLPCLSMSVWHLWCLPQLCCNVKYEMYSKDWYSKQCMVNFWWAVNFQIRSAAYARQVHDSMALLYLFTDLSVSFI